MLSGRHALVTDFGVAKAVSEATGRHQLTTIGVALGTPAYMAPEQAEASENIDHRADIYALGAMAYELLAGASPFAGRSPQVMLMAHVTQAPEPVTTHRETVPPALAHLVMRCLEKKPADRWQSAEEMRGHLEALATPSGGMTPTDTVPVSVSATTGTRSMFTPAKLGVAAAVIVAAAFGVTQMRSGAGPRSAATADGQELDPDVVAIMPFRFSGPENLSYLGDGIVDLLAARLTGDVGPRAVDPAASNAIWQDRAGADPSGAAESTARTLGAGLLLTGSIVSDPSGLNVNASLRSVTDASEVANASARGPADSLTATVDRVVSRLLSLSAGEYQESLDQLTSTSPEALREYLLGRQQFKGAQCLDSGEHFRRAVEIDSTFALAAISWADAAANGLGTAPGALTLAWRHRDRLSERDRAYLQARLGPNYPEGATVADRIRSWEAAAGLIPDRAQIWYQLGDLYLHGVDQRTAEWAQRTRGYFERAIELDPRHAPSIMHIALVDQASGDLTAAREVWLSLAGLSASTDAAIVFPNLMAAALSPDLSGFPEAFAATLASPSMNDLVAPAGMIEFMVTDTTVVGALREMMEEAISRPMTAAEIRQVHYSAFLMFQDLGRPGRALEVAEPWVTASRVASPRTRLLHATYGSLPRESGAAMVANLEAQLAALSDFTGTHLQHLMAIEMWRLAQGDSDRSIGTVGTHDTSRHPGLRGATSPGSRRSAGGGAHPLSSGGTGGTGPDVRLERRGGSLLHDRRTVRAAGQSSTSAGDLGSWAEPFSGGALCRPSIPCAGVVWPL